MERSIFNQAFIGKLTEANFGALRAQIASHGLAIFVCEPTEMREALLSTASRLGDIHAHPHGDDDGTTTISPRPFCHLMNAAAGFSQSQLPVHTDASATEAPPAFLLNGFVTCSATGGATLLVDMKKVHEKLTRMSPHTVEAFSRNGSMYFGSGSNVFSGSVFSKKANTIRVRFRMDGDGLVPAVLLQEFKALTDCIEEFTATTILRPGEGYIIDNHRWLHGRTAFTGDRQVLRVLARTKANDDFSTGFPDEICQTFEVA